MDQLSLTLLGGFAVTLDGEPVTAFDSNKVRALLAYLAVESGRTHRRESLAALLWPGYPDRSARTNLRNALANLRTAIGDREAEPPFLLITRETLQFNVESDHWLDVARLEDALSSAKRVPTDELAEAADLYTGDFLAGFTLEDAVGFDDWASVTGERLRRQALDLLGVLVDRLTAEGDAERALVYARRRVELELWRESAQRQLMRLLAATGRRSAALAQYAACCRALTEQLGVAPSPETTALYERIRDITLTGSGRPDSRTPTVSTWPRHNLPAQMTPTIGREMELAQIDGYLHDRDLRLLTLVGPGGSGKTRLALRVGEQQLGRFRDGVFFVPLVSVQSPRRVWSAMAQALGFAFAQTRPGEAVGMAPETLKGQLINYLRKKRILLILDNAEHLLDADEPEDSFREAVAELLIAAPDSKVLVTSRARLRMLSEQLVPVEGVAYREPRQGVSTSFSVTPAVQLFTQGAQRVSPGFTVTAENSEAVAAICRAVQGLPLALLLAATWVDMLSPDEIAGQLSATANEGLDLLSADWGDVPERHQSLRAVFDGSWALLTTEEQAAFAALSIFRGSFTRQAARAIADASLPTLRSLVSKSTLQVSEGRYELHPLLQQYAAARLSESGRLEPVSGRHCSHYTARIRQWSVDLKGSAQVRAAAEMDLEIESAIAAWDWAVGNGDTEGLLTMIEGLGLYYDRRGRYAEARAVFGSAADELTAAGDRVAACEPGRVLALVYILSWLMYFPGELANNTGLVERSRCLLHSPVLSGQDTRRCHALVSLRAAGVAQNEANLEEAWALAEEARNLYRSVGDRWWEARVLHQMGQVAWLRAAFGTAVRLRQEALGIYRALQDARGIGDELLGLGAAWVRQGDVEQGHLLWEEALIVYDQVGYRPGVAVARTCLGVALFWSGRLAESQEALELCRSELGDVGWDFAACDTGAGIANARMLLGDYAGAAAVAKEGLATAQKSGWVGIYGRYHMAIGGIALARRQPEEASAALKKSVALYAGRATDEKVIAKSMLSIARLQLGDTESAHNGVMDVLELCVSTKAYMPLYYVLPAAALVLAQSGQIERGIALYALARERFDYVANAQWFEDVVGCSVYEAARPTLSRAEIAAAEVCGRSLCLQETIRTVLAELSMTQNSGQLPDEGALS